jgi:hypothetical protein
VAEATERRKAMAESKEVRAGHEEVEEFVGKLRGFHGSLKPLDQHMLVTILESAQACETGGYGRRWPRYEGPNWNDLIGWIEEQGEEDTQGFGRMRR